MTRERYKALSQNGTLSRINSNLSGKLARTQGILTRLQKEKEAKRFSRDETFLPGSSQEESQEDPPPHEEQGGGGGHEEGETSAAGGKDDADDKAAGDKARKVIAGRVRDIIGLIRSFKFTKRQTAQLIQQLLDHSQIQPLIIRYGITLESSSSELLCPGHGQQAVGSSSIPQGSESFALSEGVSDHYDGSGPSIMQLWQP